MKSQFPHDIFTEKNGGISPRFPSDRIVGATSLQRGGPSRHGAANEASDDDEG